jgi:peptide/nickel transport system substrate-binding protein
MRGSRSILHVLLMVGAIGIACAGPAAAENVLRWASTGGALTADPHAYDETPTAAQHRQFYEQLIQLDSDLTPAPALATGWRLVEPTIWQFQLRDGVRFHDGTPFSAADVVFSFERARTELPAGFAARIESIAEVRAVDQHTIRIKTKFPDPQMWEKVSYIAIMSEAWARAHEARVPANVSAGEANYASRHANGTGPFILKEFEPNGPVVMVRNPDWWGLERYPHNIDRIGFTPSADPERRLAALLHGDLHLLTDPPFVALDRIRSTPGLKLAEGKDLRTIWLCLEQSRAELRSSNVKRTNPFKDKRVRQAIYQAIDIEAIRKDIMRGLALPAGMLVGPSTVGYAPELDQRLPYDPDAARRLLAEAGYPDGFSVTLDCPNNSNMTIDEAICRAIAEQLNEIGIAVTVNAQPKQDYWAKIDNRDADFWMDSWSALDGQVVLHHYYRTGDSVNASGYSNPRVDELIDEIDREMITYGRDAIIEEVWKIVLGDVVYVPLQHQLIVWAMRDNLDIPVFPFNRPLFREARFTAPKVN